MKALKMKMSHFTLLLQQTQVAMPSASSLFHDTLLNKINDLMKLHIRLIDNKIRKHMKTFTAIILINPLILYFEIYNGYIHGVNTCKFKNVQTTGCFTNLPRQ